MKTRSLWYKFGASLLVSIVIMVVLLSTTVVTNLLPVVGNIEKNLAADEASRVTNAIFQELRFLHALNLDWAAWDDTYDFISDPDTAYVTSNLNDESLQNIALSALIYYRPDGSVVWGKTWNPDDGQPVDFVSLPLDKPPRPGYMLSLALNSDSPRDGGYTGLLETRLGLMLVSLRPIVRSDLSGAPAGVLLMGKLLQNEALEKIRYLVGLYFDLVMLRMSEDRAMYENVVARITTESPVLVTQTGRNSLTAYTLLPDMQGDLSILLSVGIDREFSRLVSGAFVEFGVFTGLAMLVVMCFFAILIYGLVIQPLEKLKEYVSALQVSMDSEHPPPKHFSEDEIGQVGRMFYQLFSHIQAQSQQLRDLSLKDALTGLANRRAFDQYLESEWRRCCEDSVPLSLILCDVDEFKAFNDHYGHALGDTVLREVAAAIDKSANKRRDMAARYGGEEFVIVLPETTPAQALQVAERGCASVRDLAIRHDYAPHSKVITISCGVTGGIPGKDDKPEDWLQVADIAMYKAKRAGRNRVCELPAAGGIREITD